MTDGQHAPTGSKGPKPAVLIGVGVAVLAVLAIAGFFVFGRKSSGPAGITTVSGSPSKVGFQFQEARSKPITTSAGADQKKAGQAAAPVASQVTQQLNTLYGEGFLDPANWQPGKYDNALTVFDTGALAEAQQQIDVLTAGTAAGSTFSSIDSGQGKLEIQVLVDKQNTADAAIGIVTFTAVGKGKDGTSVTIRSQGQYIFRNVGGTWKIVSFNVKRADVVQTVVPSSSGSATP